jgi:OmpA-OmpF porin, OOP family
MSPRTLSPRTVASLSLLAGLLAACGTATATSSASPSPGCASVSGGVRALKPGAVTMMRDATPSVSPGADQASVEWIVAETAQNGYEFSAARFGGSDAEVAFNPCFHRTPFVPRGNNEGTRRRNAAAFVRTATDEILRQGETYRSTDTVAALRAGVESVKSATGLRRVIVLTDGIPTGGCAALTDPMSFVSAEVDPIVEACDSAGLLPEAKGIEIWIVGVGVTGEPLRSDVVSFLELLNRRLCEATGATCTVSSTRPTTF